MHFAIAPEHLNFFQRHHYIEFENLLTQEEVETLLHALNTALPHQYDTWRGNPIIQKFVLRKQFAEIASNLTKISPLRIAFDRILISDKNFFENPLQEMSCIRGLVCGCILNLALPNMGSALFFKPHSPPPLDDLTLTTLPPPQLMIVYSKDKSLYTYQKNDPHTHTLKKLGYVFGDRLKDTTHPTLYRG